MLSSQEMDTQSWDSGIGLVVSLNSSVVLFFANRKRGASNPWHAVASPLVQLSPVVECDKVPTEDMPWKPVAFAAGMMTMGLWCGRGLQSALEPLLKESDKL